MNDEKMNHGTDDFNIDRLNDTTPDTSNKHKNNTRKVFTVSETILLVLASLLVGLSIGLLRENKSIIKDKNTVQDIYLKEFIENYNFIVDNYYEEVNKDDLIKSAIAGMMDSLEDPYSVYFNEEESNNFSITLNGSYVGLGVQIAKDEESGYIIVTSVFKDSPAAEAGILAGDFIVSIDNQSSTELSASEFSAIVKNGYKDTYTLKILRDDEEIEKVLNRRTVSLMSVTSEKYNLGDKTVGYIYIGIFANNTYNQFVKALTELENEGIDYLILDVRGNTGGHLTTVDGILDLFLNSNQILYQFEQAGNITSIYGTGNEKKDYEIILIGDESSASASEVLIAGLKENLNSKLIGTKTFGKGTVQELVTLSDGTQYKITIKKWLTPNGNWVNATEGISPDIEVELDKKYYITYSEEDDNQLQAAFNYIKEK